MPVPAKVTPPLTFAAKVILPMVAGVVAPPPESVAVSTSPGVYPVPAPVTVMPVTLPVAGLIVATAVAPKLCCLKASQPCANVSCAAVGEGD